MRLLGAISLMCLMAFAERAVADTVALGPSKDNTLFQDDAGAQSDGQGQHFFAGRSGTGAIRRGLVAFDVAGNIPAGSTIQNVSLKLHMSRAPAGAPEVEVDLYPVLADWGEGTSVGVGEEGSGAASTPGDATWIHTFFDQQLWSTPGGDISPMSSANAAVSTVGFYQFDAAFNPGLVTDVQGWLDQPAANFGWALQTADEFFPMSAKRFDTRENVNPDFRPVLTIDYTPPTDPVPVE